MILPPAILGMLGGGQLGRFFVSAAHEMGYQVWVLDPDKNSPAGQIAERHFCVDYTDYAALDEFAAGCAAITTEFENVPAAHMRRPSPFARTASPKSPSCATTVFRTARSPRSTAKTTSAMPMPHCSRPS